ncbi:acetyltransferase [bacterium]|nr:acetyltransferase [bacterium]MDB4205925.1 acetyltransferase [bacterium]
MSELVIVGAGGHGRETLDIVEAINAVEPTWAFAGFVDDGEVIADRLERRDASLLGTTKILADTDPRYVIGIGSPAVRAKLDEQLTAWGRTAATLIHPAATVASDNRISDGVLLAAGARVTTNVTLGRHVHLNVNAVVSHDCVVGDYTTLSPGALVNGDVRLAEGVFLGTGAIITPGITIGDHAVIGAGAVVVRDVPPGVTVRGVPAR